MAYYDYITAEFKGDINSETITALIQQNVSETALSNFNVTRDSCRLTMKANRNYTDASIIISEFEIGLFGTGLTASHFSKWTEWALANESVSGKSARVKLQWNSADKWIGFFDGLRSSVSYKSDQPLYSYVFTDRLAQSKKIEWEDVGSFITTDSDITLSDIIANCLYTLGYTDFSIYDFSSRQYATTLPITPESFLYNNYLTDADLKLSPVDGGTYTSIYDILDNLMLSIGCVFYQDYDGAWYVVPKDKPYYYDTDDIGYFKIDYTSIYGRSVGSHTSGVGICDIENDSDIDLINYTTRIMPSYTLRVVNSAGNVSSFASRGISNILERYEFTADFINAYLATNPNPITHPTKSSLNVRTFTFNGGATNQAWATSTVPSDSQFSSVAVKANAIVFRATDFPVGTSSTFTYRDSSSPYEPAPLFYKPTSYDVTGNKELNLSQTIDLQNNIVSRSGMSWIN